MTSAERRDVRAKVPAIGHSTINTHATRAPASLLLALDHIASHCIFTTGQCCLYIRVLAGASLARNHGCPMCTEQRVGMWPPRKSSTSSTRYRLGERRGGERALGGEILSDHLRPHILPAERRSSFPSQTCGTCKFCHDNARYVDGSSYPAMLAAVRFSGSRVAR